MNLMKETLDLVRDLLDVQLIDRRRCRIGRVDGVLIELRGDRPPRVATIEVGAVTLARRLHPRLATWLRAIALRFLPVPLGTVRIPLTLARDIGVDVDVDLDAHADRRMLRLEKWLIRHVVRRIPGAGA
jgi:hypothetical protein